MVIIDPGWVPRQGWINGQIQYAGINLQEDPGPRQNRGSGPT